MTTTADLIAATRTHLDGSDRGVVTTLPSPLDATAGTITVPLANARLLEGFWLSAGLETFYVAAVDPSGTATLIRAQDGTAAVSHSAGETVRVGPRFTDARILQALNDTLGSLPSKGLYRPKTLDRTAVSGRVGYDLANDMVDAQPLELRWHRTGIAEDWRELRDYTVSTDMPAADFPSGVALFLNDAVTAGASIRIRYKARFASLVSLSDDVAVNTGLPLTALDIPPLGAAVRLLAGRPVQRADFTRQGEPRRADEVRTSDVLQAPSLLRQFFAERVGEERDRLTALHPKRSRR